jgi:hypothetical protein
MFGSKTLLRHIVRGLIGLAAIVAAIFLTRRGDVMSMVGAALLVIVALIAWRGCPLCWLTGMFNTPRK